MKKCRSNGVEVPIGLQLIPPEGPPIPVAATLHYAGNDPFAIHVVFHTHQTALHTTAELYTRLSTSDGDSEGSAATARRANPTTTGGDISWSFSRELLADGLKAPTGYGDVRVWPWDNNERRAIALALSSPDGYALFEAPRSVIEKFLARSYLCIPAGTEQNYIDIDSSLADLLSEPDVDPR